MPSLSSRKGSLDRWMSLVQPQHQSTSRQSDDASFHQGYLEFRVSPVYSAPMMLNISGTGRPVPVDFRVCCPTNVREQLSLSISVFELHRLQDMDRFGNSPLGPRAVAFYDGPRLRVCSNLWTVSCLARLARAGEGGDAAANGPRAANFGWSFPSDPGLSVTALQWHCSGTNVTGASVGCVGSQRNHARTHASHRALPSPSFPTHTQPRRSPRHLILSTSCTMTECVHFGRPSDRVALTRRVHVALCAMHLL
jgi:hypothetical protein